MSYFPPMNSFALPPLKHLKTDLPASISLVIVAIPLCLGIAHASGAPLMAGLIAGIIGGLVVGYLSDSNLSVSGPAAGLTTICLASITELGSYQGLVTAVFLAGIMQIIFGYLKLGFFSNYIPSPVIKGMLSAIGLMLILKQVPHLVGYDAEEMGSQTFDITNEEIVVPSEMEPGVHENTITHLLHTVKHLNYAVFAVGFFSILVLVLWDKFFGKKYKTIPGSLIAVLLGTFLSLIINYFHVTDPIEAEHFVSLPDLFGENAASTHFTLISSTFLGKLSLYKIALTIAIVASLESLLSIEAIEKLDPIRHRINTNKELVAQGAGNMVSALIGGLPITSVIVRGSVNISAGAKTKWSAILHGFFILLFLVLLVPVINQIPLASLAAVLCYTGYKLINPDTFKEQYKRGLYQFIPFLVTIIAIIFSDLLIGVLVGLTISSFFILRENYQSPVMRVMDLGLRKRILLGNNVSFLHKYQIIKELEKIEPNSIVEIDGSRTEYIDSDVIDAIKEFRISCQEKNIELIIGGILNMDTKEEVNKQIEESYNKLFENNKKWVKEKTDFDPSYFKNLSKGQKPEYLFIGCSDSRVPANEITGTDPGEMFVHRNIANMVVNTDINLLSVLQYSVEVLNVKHVIVCGHYGCGGVKAALEAQPLGLIDKWLRNIKDVYRLHRVEIEAETDPEKKHRLMVELNVREQVFNLMKTSFVQKNRELYGFPQVHGWVYDIADGYINDLNINIDDSLGVNDIYKLK
jgi:carbonic anhydrase